MILLFTFTRMMPFKDKDGDPIYLRGGAAAVPALEVLDFSFLVAFTVGALIREMRYFLDIFFPQLSVSFITDKVAKARRNAAAFAQQAGTAGISAVDGVKRRCSCMHGQFVGGVESTRESAVQAKYSAGQAGVAQASSTADDGEAREDGGTGVRAASVVGARVLFEDDARCTSTASPPPSPPPEARPNGASGRVAPEEGGDHTAPKRTRFRSLRLAAKGVRWGRGNLAAAVATDAAAPDVADVASDAEEDSSGIGSPKGVRAKVRTPLKRMDTKAFNMAIKEGGAGGGVLVSNWISQLDNLFDGECWERYLLEHGMDVLVRVLSLMTLSLAFFYTEEDYKISRVGIFEQETILAATVLLAWLRKVRQTARNGGGCRRGRSALPSSRQRAWSAGFISTRLGLMDVGYPRVAAHNPAGESGDGLSGLHVGEDRP